LELFESLTLYRAPSLDTINRSYRNITIAIEQQTDDINLLDTRISKISIADATAASSLSLVQRDARLPDPPNRRPINVTPDIAVTTAAALNAERSAQKLKRALLAVRKEPLLNTRAAAVPIAPLALNSPRIPESGVKDGKLKVFEDLQGPLFSEPVEKVSELGLDDWNLPEDHFDPSGSHASPGGTSSTRRDKPRRSHRGGSAVRKSPAPESSAKPDAGGTLTGTPHTSTSTPAPVSFDWGPLPTFASPTPLKALPMTFMPITPPVQNAAVGDGMNLPGPKPLEPQKTLPKGFVSFSTFSQKSWKPHPRLPVLFLEWRSEHPKGIYFRPPSSKSISGFFIFESAKVIFCHIRLHSSCN
jgi:nucleoporin NUP159